MQSAFSRLNLYDSLDVNNTYTLFAPNDEAFAKAGITLKSVAAMNIDSLRTLMKYHIVPGRYYSSDLPLQRNFEYQTLAGYPLYTTSRSDGSTNLVIEIDGVRVLKDARRDVILKNGVVHFIGQPLRYNRINAKQFLERDPELTIFIKLLKHFDLWKNIDTDGPLTIYAPVNKAFEDNGLTANYIEAMDVNKYYPEFASFYAFDFKKELGLGIDPPKEIHNPKPNGDLVSLAYINYGGPTVLVRNEDSNLYIFYGREFNYLEGKDNNLVSNGVVHKMGDIFFTPESTLKNR